MTKEEHNKKDNSSGVASVVLGIISLTLNPIQGVTLAIVGLVFGIKQKNKMRNSWSKAGIILNIISIILGIVIFTFLLSNPEFLTQLQSQIPNA